MIALPPMTPPIKRSVTIDGHRTSVSLEEAFWRALGVQAERQGVTRATLIGMIDHARPPGIGLATALRLYVLARAGDAQDPAAPREAGSTRHGSGQVGPAEAGSARVGHDDAGPVRTTTGGSGTSPPGAGAGGAG